MYKLLIQKIKMPYKSCAGGFTLAELLIALAILGVIATFTIPKVLQTQQSAMYNANAKEAISMIVGMQQQAMARGGIAADTSMGLMTPYLNFVKIDSSGAAIDAGYYSGTASYTCGTGSWACIRLHNGAVIDYHPDMTFGGTGSTNAIYFFVDPDGKQTDSTTNGPNKSLTLYLYYNGKLSDPSNLDANTNTGWYGSANSVTGPWSPSVPPWFHWN